MLVAAVLPEPVHTTEIGSSLTGLTATTTGPPSMSVSVFSVHLPSAGLITWNTSLNCHRSQWVIFTLEDWPPDPETEKTATSFSGPDPVLKYCTPSVPVMSKIRLSRPDCWEPSISNETP